MVRKVAPTITRTSSQKGVNRATQDTAPDNADYETALDSVGYGSFSRSVLGACSLGFFTTGVENCLMSYVLPAARCELDLTTYQAGLINMAFMSGGVASAFFWGIVADVFGRRNILSLTLLLDAVVTLAQSMSPDYRVLLAARTFNGFLIGGPANLLFTYVSDLVGEKKRQFYLSIVGMSFVMAWLILPAAAWAIIPFKMEYPAVLPLSSWRLFMALASLPAFGAGAWVLYLPESPRLLLDTNRGDQALKLLAMINTKNHGKDAEFKIKKLIQDGVFVTKTMNSEENRTKDLFMGVLRDLKILVSKSYALKSSLILFVFFANMAAGFGLSMWIPELLLRMQTRDCPAVAVAPAARTLNATSSAWKDPAKLYNSYAKPELVAAFNASVGALEKCNSIIDQEVFTSGLIVGACCVLGNAACALLCARGGAGGVRRAAAACAGTCALACVLLATSACGCSASNKMAVAAAAALNAASLNGNVLLIRLLLQALPAKLSGLGVCWGAWWGRSGGVASNLAVGVLLDYSCAAPFIAVAALLALSIGGILVIKLEEEKEEPQRQVDLEQAEDKNTGLDRYISTYM